MKKSVRDKFAYLTDKEFSILVKLDTPAKVQDYVSSIPQNFERHGGTCMSVREVLRTNRAHCIEGALVAALAFAIHGHKPLLMDLEANNKDEDHVVALFKLNGYWGAISKGNHAYVRYRDPIYKTIRELAMSYFHEYYNLKGDKTLRGYSGPYSLLSYRPNQWITGLDSWVIAEDLCDIKHFPFIDKKQEKLLRPVDAIQMKITKFRVHTR